MNRNTRLIAAAFLLAFSLSAPARAGNLPTVPAPTLDPAQTISTSNTITTAATDSSEEPNGEDGEQSLVEWLLVLLTQQ